MCSLLMRLQRSTSLFNFGCFAASWQHAEVNQKAQIAAVMQNVKWELRMKGLPMNRTFRTHSSSWPRATLSAIAPAAWRYSPRSVAPLARYTPDPASTKLEGNYSIELFRDGGEGAGIEKILVRHDTLTVARALYKVAALNCTERLIMLCDQK